MSSTESEATSVNYKMLSVIVPVFDERTTVAEVVRRLRNVKLPESIELEVLIVDDGSTDGTDKILQNIEDSTVRVVRHKTNQGKGASIRDGIRESRGDIILVQDADLEYSPEDITRLIAPIVTGRAKVVYGSRFHPEREAMSLTSVIADRALSVAAAVLYNTTVTDVETGSKAFDAELLKSLPLKSDGFEIDPEITAKILRSGNKVFEVPISFASRPAKRPGSKSKASAFKTLVQQRFAK